MRSPSVIAIVVKFLKTVTIATEIRPKLDRHRKGGLSEAAVCDED